MNLVAGELPGHGARRVWISVALAAALHAAVIFAWPKAPWISPRTGSGEDDFAEVTLDLVEGDPVEEPATPAMPPTPPAAEETPTVEEAQIVVSEPEMDPLLPVEPPEKVVLRPPAKPAVTRPRSDPQPSSRPEGSRPGTNTSSSGPGSIPAGATGASSKVFPLSKPRPGYPPESRLAREQGTVLLRLTVTAQGSPESISVQRSSGHPRLDAAAVAGVRQWRFRPAIKAGIAVAATVTIPVRFDLPR